MNIPGKSAIKLGSAGIAILLIAALLVVFIPARVDVTGDGRLSVTFDYKVYASPDIVTNSPNSTSGDWATPEDAYADDSSYASVTSGTPSASHTYSGYGFSLAGNNIDQVRVRYDAWCAGNLITYVGAGAGVEADNADLTPALPTGFQANDLLLCFASARGAGTQGTPTDWTQLFQVSHASSGINKIALFYKIAAGGDANPTVTYTGGISKDTVIAQCAAFRGVDITTPFDVQGTTASNASQQPIGPISGITPSDNNSLVIVFGHKADDWTSVGTLAGDGLTWSEIGEPMSNLGSDAGQVWDYAIISGSPIAITDKTFTVTGGKTEPGMGLMVSVRPDPYEQIRVDVTWDGGISWSSQQVTTTNTTETTYWYDVTSATPWTSDNLTDAYFNVRVDANTQGVASEVRLDWIPVEVDYSLPDIIIPPPTSRDFLTVSANTSYWSLGANTTSPFPGLTDDECYFEVTNNSTAPVNITIKATNFSGLGGDWTLTDPPGPDNVTLRVFKSGATSETDNVTLTISEQGFISDLGVDLSEKWELKMETPTEFSEGSEKTSTITLTATFP